MTSTIYIYKDCKIIPSKNFVVDSIDTYLANLTKITISDFQYLRNDLNLTIKINKTQDWTDATLTYNYNYLKVVQNSVSYYYFILKKTQVSQSTIALELRMDVLNTYRWSSDFGISPRTKVNREHKDRFNKWIKSISYAYESVSVIQGSINYNTTYTGEIILESGYSLNATLKTGYNYEPNRITITFENEKDSNHFLEEILEMNHDFTFENDSYEFLFSGVDEGEEQEETYSYYRNIDFYNEGINPLLYKKELGLLEDSKNNMTWNLLYKNSSNDSEAVECYCIPDDLISILIPASETLLNNDFEDGKNYLFAPWYNYSFTFKDHEDNLYKVSRSWKTGNIYYFNCVGIRRSGTKIYIRKIRYQVLESGEVIGGSREFIGSEKEITSVSFDKEDIYYLKNNSYFNPASNYLGGFPSSNGSFSASSDTTYQLKTLSEVDRVESTLIKIISIPYFPLDYDWANDKIYLSNDLWTYDATEKSLQLTDLNTRFLATITTNILNPLNVFNVSLSPANTDLRNDNNESKIYHSEFYQPKFVYDSFGFVFELEKIDTANFQPSTNFEFEFIMTTTINSKFMFKFPQYVLKLSTSDYDNILPVARNNERPIYNSSYITYLRTAYRYDLKQYYQKEGLIKFGVATGTWGNLTSAIKTGTEGNVFGAVSSMLSFGQSLMQAITQQQTNEWNIQAKLDQLKAQANSVSGSDDIDLLENYSNNKAKLCLYQVSDRMKKLVLDLFYYFGYTTSEMKVPSIDTRYWFNFVSCDLEFTGISKNMSDAIKADIVQRYKDGATFLHHREILGVNMWDFAQEKENWETSLME